MHIKDLVPDPANRRQHNPRNIGMLRDALGKVGASRSIVVDEHDVILAGNGVVEAASEAGLTKVQIVEADGETIIAVRRRGLTETQKRELAIYDNRTAELATWNVEQLQADLRDGLDLAPFFFDEELQAVLGESGVKAGLTDPDFVPAARATGIVAGDLFELGAHRLLCGDCTVAGDVARLLGDVAPFLMVTDPPYGVGYVPAWRNDALGEANRAIGVVKNDDRFDWTPAWSLFAGDVAYVWHASLFGGQVADSLESTGFTLRSHLIWAKQHFVISRGHYHWQHECCLYAFRDGTSARWNGDRSQTTLWNIQNGLSQGGPRGPEDDSTGHGTQKPVECMARPIRNHDCETVYDPFLGSGTTMIAAEGLNRSSFTMEIEPVYCQVSIDRWEAFTGQKAVKVGEAVRA